MDVMTFKGHREMGTASESGGLSRLMNPSVQLRLEGAVLLALSLFLYARHDGNWLLFALLLLAPDVSMLGYLAGSRVGAAVYNAFHAYTLPVALGIVGLVWGNSLLLSLALIWSAHIGMDRLVGYGLKYPSGFRHTHLDRR